MLATCRLERLTVAIGAMDDLFPALFPPAARKSCMGEDTSHNLLGLTFEGVSCVEASQLYDTNGNWLIISQLQTLCNIELD